MGNQSSKNGNPSVKSGSQSIKNGKLTNKTQSISYDQLIPDQLPIFIIYNRSSPMVIPIDQIWMHTKRNGTEFSNNSDPFCSVSLIGPFWSVPFL